MKLQSYETIKYNEIGIYPQQHTSDTLRSRAACVCLFAQKHTHTQYIYIWYECMKVMSLNRTLKGLYQT